MAAMMALEAIGEPMFDHPCRAIWALETVPAMATQSQRRKTTAVEKQQHLFPPRQSLRHGSDKRRGQPAAPIGRGLHQINRRHIGHLCGPIAARQFDFLIAALGNLLAGFNCGRGGGEDHGDLFKMPPHHRGIACMILHALFLLEAGFMRFIDHNQPEIVIGQVKRGAGTNSHQGLARGNRAIGATAL